MGMSGGTVFKVGDTVRLNSGGLLMTVVSLDGDSLTCPWSVKDNVKSKTFPAAALKKAGGVAAGVTERLTAALKRTAEGNDGEQA
jgi:uncharacterized protein YodC (DUF2158 family)